MIASVVLVAGCTGSNQQSQSQQVVAAPAWDNFNYCNCLSDYNCNLIRIACKSAIDSGSKYLEEPSCYQYDVGYVQSFYPPDTCKLDDGAVAREEATQKYWGAVISPSNASIEKEACVNQVCSPYILDAYDVWKKCSDLCGQSRQQAQNYIQSISPNSISNTPSETITDNNSNTISNENYINCSNTVLTNTTFWQPYGTSTETGYVKYKINDTYIHIYSDESGVGGKFDVINMTGHKFISGETLEFDFIINKIEGNIAAYFSFNRQAIIGLGIWGGSVDGGYKLGKYHIKSSVLNCRTVASTITLPDNTKIERNLTNLNNLFFDTSFSYGGGLFDFEYTNFSIH